MRKRDGVTRSRKREDDTGSRETNVTERVESSRAPAEQILVTLDATHKRRWFATSEVASLRTWEATESELVAAVLATNPGYTLDRLMHEGAAFLAKRLLAVSKSPRLLHSPQRRGVADKRLERAFERLTAANFKAKAEGRRLRRISAWTLSEGAKTSWRTAQRWLKEHASSEAKDSP